MPVPTLLGLPDLLGFGLQYVDDLFPLGLCLVAFASLGRYSTIDQELLVRAAVATIGSAFVAYGLRELLRAWGGGYYCCNQAFYAATGLVIAGVGWVFLVAALRGSTLASR